MRTREGHGFTDLGAAEQMWQDFRNADVDARYVLSEVAPATELAEQIVERARSAGIRYPKPTSEPESR